MMHTTVTRARMKHRRVVEAAYAPYGLIEKLNCGENHGLHLGNCDDTVDYDKCSNITLLYEQYDTSSVVGIYLT